MSAPRSTNAAAVATAVPATAVPATTPARRGRHLPAGLYALLVVGVFGAVIGAAALTGTWQTSGKTAAGGQRVAAVGESVTEIKGWMTLGEVTTAFGVPLADVLAAFELPADTPPTTALKDLESDLFSVTALRDWIEAYRAAGGVPPAVPAAPAASTEPGAAASSAPSDGVPASPTEQP